MQRFVKIGIEYQIKVSEDTGVDIEKQLCEIFNSPNWSLKKLQKFLMSPKLNTHITSVNFPSSIHKAVNIKEVADFLSDSTLYERIRAKWLRFCSRLESS